MGLSWQTEVSPTWTHLLLVLRESSNTEGGRLHGSLRITGREVRCGGQAPIGSADSKHSCGESLIQQLEKPLVTRESRPL